MSSDAMFFVIASCAAVIVFVAWAALRASDRQ
jgi:hypothetical protein